MFDQRKSFMNELVELSRKLKKRHIYELQTQFSIYIFIIVALCDYNQNPKSIYMSPF